jgi:hypothetical protein
MKKYELIRQELIVVERAAWWNPQMRRILRAAPLVVLYLLLNSRAARASCSFSPTPDPTADGASNSLRAAIQAANASGQDCLIQLQAGTYTLSIKNTNGQENAAAQGDLDITDSGHTVTIQGQGPQATIINGNGANGINDRVFQVLGGANAVFRKLTIEGGIAQDDGTAGVQPGTTPSDGGGLLVQDGGHVTLSEVTVKDNQATGGNGAVGTKSSLAGTGKPGQAAAGGGLFLAAGTIDLAHSKIFGNATKGGTGAAATGYSTTPGPGGAGGLSAGGGLYVLSGRASLFRSTVAGNVATGGGGGMGGRHLSYSSLGGAGGPGGQGTGGGLYVLSGSAALSASAINSNQAAGGLGGGAGGGTARFSSGGNGGSGQGAGLFVRNGTLSLSKTIISGNSAIGGGGASGTIGFGGYGGPAQGAGAFVGNGHIRLDNSTLFANTAKGGLGGGAFSQSNGTTHYTTGGDAAGGGLYLSSGTVSLAGDTVASNQALTGFEHTPVGESYGGGIANAGAISLLTNTTLIANNFMDSGNANNGADVFGAITASYSLFGQTTGATITNNGGNVFDKDPLLDPGGLRRNGGPTRTVALQIGSPAIDKGNNAVCAAAEPTGLGGVDQRGYSRFPHGDNLCDIGAFEFYNLLVHPKFEYFAPQPVGQGSQPRDLFITNNQATSVALSTTVGGNDPADFIENDNCGATLAANVSCTIAITFKPSATGNRSAVLSVSDSPDRTSPYIVKLVGEGK